MQKLFRPFYFWNRFRLQALLQGLTPAPAAGKRNGGKRSNRGAAKKYSASEKREMATSSEPSTSEGSQTEESGSYEQRKLRRNRTIISSRGNPTSLFHAAATFQRANRRAGEVRHASTHLGLADFSLS